MIQTIEGRIGGGKTYTAVGWICNHLAKGGVVATNINLQRDSFSDQYGKKRGLAWVLKREYSYKLKGEQIIYLSDSALIEYTNEKGKTYRLNEIVMFYKLVPRGTPDKPVMVVIDEAHIHFPQDGYRSIPVEVLHFLTLSRHACVDVVFISQHIKNMWCQMLRLAQFRWAIRDMKKYGIPFGFFNLPWLFPHFLKIKLDYDGITVMSRHMEWARSYLYECYKSPEMASSFESMPSAASVEVEKVELNVMQKIFLVLSGVAAGVAICVVPACMSSGSDSRDQSSVVSPVADTVKTVQNRQNESKQLIENEEIEFYVGHLSSGYNSKLFTTAETYEIGSYYRGNPVVLIDGRSMVVQLQDGSTVRHTFQKKPKLLP